MKWLAVFLVVFIFAVACGDVAENASSPVSATPTSTEIIEMEQRIKVLEKEVWGGFASQPLAPFESRIDKLDDLVEDIANQVGINPYMIP